ncbi:MAG: Uncharacterised protein [Synechococcus sp. CC9902]|nr:MAG: Uncharacterised protein [Synechococcus sp. CC9902]
MISAKTSAAVALLAGLMTMAVPVAQAQSEGWILGPGSRNDKNSTVVPTNCVKAEDGSITCDTKLENKGTSSAARPYYNPFND